MSLVLKNPARLVIDMIGDSTMYQMESVGQNTIAPGALRLIYGAGGSSYWASGTQLGSGVTALGNALSSALGVPVDFRLGALGGSALCPNGSGPYWYSTLSGAPYDQYLQICTASSEAADFAIMDIGTGDAGVAHADVYRNTMRAFLAQSAGQQWNKLFIVGLGNNGGVAPLGVQEIRRAQVEAIALCSDLVFACNRYDQPMVDGVHLTAAGYASQGRRIAQNILNAYGYSSVSANGPRIVSACRSGSTIAVSCSHAAGATTLRQASTGIPSGFRFSADGFATTLSPTGFSLSTSTMTFTFASLPAGTLWMDYGFGNVAPDAHIVSDDVFPQGDSKACPLQVCEPIVVS